MNLIMVLKKAVKRSVQAFSKGYKPTSKFKTWEKKVGDLRRMSEKQVLESVKGIGEKSAMNEVIKLLSKTGTEAHMWAINTDSPHWKKGKFVKCSFTGPGTNLKKRLDSKGRPKPFSIPVFPVDKFALAHDKAYHMSEEIEYRNKSDFILLTETFRWYKSKQGKDAPVINQRCVEVVIFVMALKVTFDI